MSEQRPDPEILELLKRIEAKLEELDHLGRRLTVLDLKLGALQAVLDYESDRLDNLDLE